MKEVKGLTLGGIRIKSQIHDVRNLTGGGKGEVNRVKKSVQNRICSKEGTLDT